jgi:hypothetical protein
MTTSYPQERFSIPIEKGDNETRFTTASGLYVATGYTRIVIGKRGPYIEFAPEHIMHDSLHIPDDKKWKIAPSLQRRYDIDYIEWRTNDEADVKFYEQLKTVDYADYKVGMMYASPFELYANGGIIVEAKRKKKKEDDIMRLF